MGSHDTGASHGAGQEAVAVLLTTSYSLLRDLLDEWQLIRVYNQAAHVDHVPLHSNKSLSEGDMLVMYSANLLSLHSFILTCSHSSDILCILLHSALFSLVITAVTTLQVSSCHSLPKQGGFSTQPDYWMKFKDWHPSSWHVLNTV